ncbi:MAG TPA: LemA family protein [Fluviicola sp.]|nr:LemA family protein [Fluviicola sp.]
MTVLIVSGAILLFVLLVYVLIKNGLISKENQVDNAFASVDVMLKKRFDLIPQLSACVSGYMSHEKELLEKLTALRSLNQQTDVLAKNNKELSQAVALFSMKAEAYPDLKASEQFLMLQRNISEMEEQLAAARRTYNISIQQFNDAVLKFPSSLVASINHFTKKSYLEFND